MCIIYVLYMYYIICIRSAFAGFCLFFLGFWHPRRFLYVLLLAFAGFSWLFGVRGDFCMPDVENTVRKEDQIILQGGGPPGGQINY